MTTRGKKEREKREREREARVSEGGQGLALSVILPLK